MSDYGWRRVSGEAPPPAETVETTKTGLVHFFGSGLLPEMEVTIFFLDRNCLNFAKFLSGIVVSFFCNGWDLAEFVVRYSQVWVISSPEWMKSSRVVRAFDSQCRSRNYPGFDPIILRHSGIWGAADEAVLNTGIVHKRRKNPIKSALKFFWNTVPVWYLTWYLCFQ